MWSFWAFKRQHEREQTIGLMIHSLGELPANVERGYFIYLLDYGWDEPLGEALLKNFDRMGKSSIAQ